MFSVFANFLFLQNFCFICLDSFVLAKKRKRKRKARLPFLQYHENKCAVGCTNTYEEISHALVNSWTHNMDSIEIFPYELFSVVFLLILISVWLISRSLFLKFNSVSLYFKFCVTFHLSL